MVRHTKRRQRGGDNPSAWSYVQNIVGNGWDQFQDSLTLQPSENIVSQQSNAIEPRGNLNAQATQAIPNSQSLSLIQSAGRRRKGRSRKGGNWMAVANQAIVPVALLGMQNRYKRRGTRASKKLRGSRRSRRTRRRF